MNMRRRKIFLFFFFFIAFILALVLRFYKLESIPLGLDVDEAAIGYNAYSILLTGKDEYGQDYPLLFRSFGDYKMPVYIYFSSPFVAFFGLNIFSVRFLSAFAGTAMFIPFVLFLRELFKERKWLPIIGAFLYAISPWSVFFSRGAFESSLAIFLLMLGMYFFLLGLGKNTSALILSSSALAISSYTYHPQRIIAPMLFTMMILVYRDQLKSKWRDSQKLVIFSFLLFFILWVPQLFFSFSDAGSTRFQQLNIFSRIGSPGKIFYEFLAQLSAYLSPRNLFFEGDPEPQNSVPELSVFFSWMVVPYFLGLWVLLKNLKNKGIKVIAFSILIFSFPASLTSDPFSSLRAQSLSIPLLIIIVLGADQLCLMIREKRVLILGAIFLFLSSLFSLYRSYFVLFPRERYEAWSYGYQKITENIREYRGKVLVSSVVQPSYIQLLFFLKYDPIQFQKTYSGEVLPNYYDADRWREDFSIGNIGIRALNWEEDIYREQLIIANSIAISDGQAKEHRFEKVFTIYSPEGKVLFNGFKTNPDQKRGVPSRAGEL